MTDQTRIVDVGAAGDLRDGSVIEGPAVLPLMSYPVDVADDRILLQLPVGQSPVNE
jgi:Rieske Fe-S protein